jgi:hypothetical protein
MKRKVQPNTVLALHHRLIASTAVSAVANIRSDTFPGVAGHSSQMLG